VHFPDTKSRALATSAMAQKSGPVFAAGVSTLLNRWPTRPISSARRTCGSSRWRREYLWLSWAVPSVSHHHRKGECTKKCKDGRNYWIAEQLP
jgi:hypothetical protein